MNKSFTVRDLPEEERPRERLASLGAEALSLHELLAILLGRGIAGESVLMTAQHIIAHFSSLHELSEASLEDLQKVKGLGFAKACQIKACLELGRRLSQSKTKKENVVRLRLKDKSSPAEAVYALVRKTIIKHAKEHFVVVSLDTRNKILGIDTVFVGTLNSSIVHPRETFEVAIRRHAAGIVVAHNHPSGDPEPSDEDIKVTNLLLEAGKVMGIDMHDHLVLGKESYFSFRDNVVRYP
jgi:DNA repair protein RadC